MSLTILAGASVPGTEVVAVMQGRRSLATLRRKPCAMAIKGERSFPGVDNVWLSIHRIDKAEPAGHWGCAFGLDGTSSFLMPTLASFSHSFGFSLRHCAACYLG